MSSHRSPSEVRASLKHPIIDGDGHWVEYNPVFAERMRKLAGDKAADGFLVSQRRIPDALKLSIAERKQRGIAMEGYWTRQSTNTRDRATAMMPRLLASVPQSVHVDLMSDRSQSIRDSVVDVEFTLLLTIGLVVMVIFIFLRHLWATIIPSITVPLSLVGTFGVMYVLGYSIDNLSLMGLTIAVGFVVDDAIVMIENIVRYIEEGEKPFDAALKGAGQIGFTIVSITFSLIAVFIPLLFMGGIVGRLFREFAVTVTVAVVMSAFVSLTLTPVMCARFLKRQTGHKRGRLDQMCEDAFDAVVRFYDRTLQWVLRHQFPTLLSTIALFIWLQEHPDHVSRPNPHHDAPAPSEPTPPVPTPSQVAQEQRSQALRACDSQLWKECLEGLDHAATIDPAGDADPRVQHARAGARQHLLALPNENKSGPAPGQPAPK